MERKKVRRFLREPAVLAALQCGRTKLHGMVKSGEFPPPFKLSDSGRAKAWDEDDLITYQESRLASREKGDSK